VFHPVAIHFKGSGFYNTDYGKQKRGAAKDGDGKSDSKSDSKSESKSESKPDSKSETKSDTKPAAKQSDSGS
jgi:predicted nucleic acid-binding Zn ribbon protein